MKEWALPRRVGGRCTIRNGLEHEKSVVCGLLRASASAFV
jgi:hypothetical protein